MTIIARCRTMGALRQSLIIRLPPVFKDPPALSCNEMTSPTGAVGEGGRVVGLSAQPVDTIVAHSRLN